MTAAPIDLAHLGLYTAGDVALERELLGLFVNNAAGSLAMLAAATDDRTWQAAVHALKGSALSIGATQVAVLAASAERFGIGDAGRAVLVELEDALQAVRAFAADRHHV